LIEYKNTHNFSASELENLFLSVKWESGRFPDKLVVAMKQSATVFSSWDGEKLIGLISALDDGVMTAYIHFLLVNPDYQGRGVGKELLRMATDKYKDYLRIVLVSNEDASYEKFGFTSSKGSTAMSISRFEF
jgi:ribosomal protein S18 acetylase RimI-like enzyme